MTTYRFELTLNESEATMMEEALFLMMNHCQKQIDMGEGAPYFARKSSAEEVLRRLFSARHKTSGNNFLKRKL